MDVQGLAAVAGLLEERARRPLPFEPGFTALRPVEPGPVWAVDGSEAVIVDNGAVWIVAWRAAAVRWPMEEPVQAQVQVEAVAPADAADRLAQRFLAHAIEAPRRVPSAEAYAEALRGLEETRVALAALARMKEGQLLLLDGAFEGLPIEAAQRLAPVRARAAERGVRVVGVAKRTSLEADGVPLAAGFDAAAHRRGLPAPWAAPVPDRPGVHVARLHAAAPFAYRVDGRLEDLASLVPLSRDAVYTGYPYPLALAHNTVAITASVRDETRHRVADAVARRAGPAAMAMLDDPHAMLDRNVG